MLKKYIMFYVKGMQCFILRVMKFLNSMMIMLRIMMFYIK